MTSKPSDGPNLEDLLRLGINTAKAGNKDNAKVIFRQVLEQDKRNERAWLWLASVEEGEIERRRILQTVLQINPNNASARKLLDRMDHAVVSAEQASVQLGVRILIGVVLLVAIVALVVIILV